MGSARKPLTLEQLGPVAKINEIAAILKMSDKTIAAFIDEGVIDAVNIAGSNSSRKCYRIVSESVRAFLNSPKRRERGF